LAEADLYKLVVTDGASYDSAGQNDMSRFTYIYILQSEIESERFYIGRTKDLRGRLSSHNAGNVRYTRRWNSWRVKTYVAVLDPECAVALERYFKSSAGRAFIKKRLWYPLLRRSSAKFRFPDFGTNRTCAE
jgi:putative endonuclease